MIKNPKDLIGFFGRKIIKILTINKIGEKVRILGISDESKKNGTPTMGGIIIIIGTIVPVLLLSKFNNIYIILLIRINTHHG